MIMERKTFRTILRSFSLLFVLVLPTNIFSCGWSESYETSRLALFRSSRASFIKLSDYEYSSDLYSSNYRVSDRDQDLNCKEWVAKLGGNIKPMDVHQILYSTNSADFQNAIESDSLTSRFKENSFIASLGLPKNKHFLNYISIAKQMEYDNEIDGKWESWTTTENQDGNKNEFSDRIIEFDKLIKNESDLFLKQRYAFLSLRASFYDQDSQNVQVLYDTYFKNNSRTILAEWAKYYMALKLDDKVLSNYNLSQILLNSDDKAQACIKHFDEKLETETLALAKNNTEKGIIQSIKLMYNPAPDLDDLKLIATLIPENEIFSFLVQREVNKIEDWIFTPKYSNTNRSDNYYDDASKSAYEIAKAENEQKDLKYLQDLKTLLIEVQTKSSGEQKDFLSSAIAQLCFVNNEIENGKNYTNQISDKANSSILLQKNIQLALVTLKQSDIKTPETQQKLYECFDNIENAVENDNSLLKSMYSLYSIASADFYDKKDVATAGLLFMKSESKQSDLEQYNYYSNKYYYGYIGYFDRMATPKDMDNLINLAEKSDKTNFEKYICSGNISKDINIYRDLKGTLAFRNNDLELAQKTFAEMPNDFWNKTYSFKDYLNENPFFPKVLQIDFPETRNFKYKFNKSEFIMEMIRLRDSKSASDYLKLANAYFNVSVYGNSWMMTSYEQSGGSYNDYIYGDSTKNQEKYGLGNYLYLILAKKYYQKALQISKNKEQKAVCSLMIFECDYCSFSTNSYVGDVPPKFKPGQEIYDFNSIYSNTKVFAKYDCPLLEQFIN